MGVLRDPGSNSFSTNILHSIKRARRTNRESDLRRKCNAFNKRVGYDLKASEEGQRWYMSKA